MTLRDLSLVLLASPIALACATFETPRVEGEEQLSGTLIRPDAPPQYDVLVAQQLASEGRHEEALEAYLRAVAKDDTSAYLHRRVAAALAQSSRFDEALYHARRAVELDPDDPVARTFLGQLYRIRRDTSSAIEALRGEDGQPVSSDAGLLLYQVYLEASRPQDALAVAEWLVERDPAALGGHLAVANVYQQMDRPADAERALREALERNPDNLRLYGALSRLLRELDRPEEELSLYREILEVHPEDRATLVALGEAQMALEDLEGAIGTFETVVELYPDDLHSMKNLAYLLFDARRYPEAVGLFARAVEEGREEYEAVFFLGVARRRMGDADGAIEAFSRIPADHPYYAEARTQIAAVHERRGRYAEALVEVERAARLDPNRSLDLYAANLRAKAGEFDAAVEQLEGLLAEQPDDDELLFNLGVIYGEAKRTEEAIAYMRRALQRNPDNASALNYIGYTWAERGERLDEAEKLIIRAIELRPDDGFIVDSLGWVYYMRALPLVESGRGSEAAFYIERALEELQRADELTGGDPVISEHLGDTYLLLDEKRRALEMFEEAIQLEPREGEQPHLFRKLETLQRELQ